MPIEKNNLECAIYYKNRMSLYVGYLFLNFTFAKKFKMKKNLLFFSLLLINSTFAQISIGLDTNFGNNGIIDFQINGEPDGLTVLSYQNNKIIAYSKVYNSIDGENFIYKFNADGSLDTTFGTNGIVTLPDYKGRFEVQIQNSDKLIVSFNYTLPSGEPNNERAILRYNANGTLDTTFGNNGEIKYLPTTGRSEKIVLLADNSLLLSDSQTLRKFTSDGQVDISYGTNGIINQTNLFYMTAAGDGNILFHNNMQIEKRDATGVLQNSFGTNGIFNYQSQSDYDVKVASNNNIFSLEQGDLPVSLNYINSQGNYITTFDNDGIISLTSDGGTLEYYEDAIFTNNIFMLVGNTLNQNPFIVSYDETGALLTVNNQDSYKELQISNGVYTSIIDFNGSLITGGDYFDTNLNKWFFTVAKYDYANLSSSSFNNSKNEFSFQNPVDSNLKLTSSTAIKTANLYGLDGKIIYSNLEDNANISFLTKGIYLLKVNFEDGTTVTKKLLKK